MIRYFNSPGVTLIISFSDCTHGFSKFGDNCYGFIRKSLTWTEAQNYCGQLNNGFLAEPRTEDENAFIVGLVASNGGGDVWLGGSDHEREGTWIWTHSGMRFNWGYTNWASGQPDNGHNGDCLQLWSRRQYSWDDDVCSSKAPFVCQSPLSEQITVE